jgi:2-polyprenyl-3-methyl-5-hydroxy-6-metoxy-1,4-benzoquinol methylase
MTQWYEALFSNYANTYDNEIFTKGTLTEVDFIENEIKHDKSLAILDIGCGTGRHSIELARRGYRVKGIDLSVSMLAKAREKATASNVVVDFQQADARNLNFQGQYELVIMLCEAGFSLMESDEMNFAILKNAVEALKSGGKIIFTCLNALYPLYHSVKDLVEGGTKGIYEGNFNVMQFRDYSTYTLTGDDGKEMNLSCNERYYAPSEITFMLRLLGINNVEIFGSQVGVFDRNERLQTNNYEMLIVAEK